jgi:nucleotide-binding universal stress UspA family protein
MNEIRDGLLALSSFPDATPTYIVDQAIDFSKILGARLSAVMFELTRSRIGPMHSFGERMIDVSSLIDEAVGKSKNESRRLLQYFENSANTHDVFHETILESAPIFPSPDAINAHAHLHDVTFLPTPDPVGLDELYTEDVIFGSGRPTIVLPLTNQKPKSAALDIIAVAWDFSRSAARALADATPILTKAKSVRMFTVVNEKPIAAEKLSDRLEQHLRIHGIDTTLERIDAAGRTAGKAIEEYALARHADMLVMGAFGHSRIMEFVLGGATRSILRHPPVPVLFSY